MVINRETTQRHLHEGPESGKERQNKRKKKQTNGHSVTLSSQYLEVNLYLLIPGLEQYTQLTINV